MGVTLQHTKLGRSKRPRMSEINVTPFVDVMLVLLIIFMVTAPLMTVGVKINLPKTQAKNIHENVEPLTVSINKDGHVFLQNTETPLEGLALKLQAIAEAKPDTRIYVRGDHEIAYGYIMKVMGALNAAGYHKVALVTDGQGAQRRLSKKSQR